MRTNTIAALMLAFTASATTLSAQRAPRDAQHRGRAVGGEVGRGQAERGQAGRTNMSPAAALLRQRERLDLTAEQVQQLTQLASARRAEAGRVTPSERLRLRADMMDARASGNTAALRASLDKASAARNAQRVAAVETREKVRAVLTTEQRAKLDAGQRRARAGRAMQARNGKARGAQVRGAQVRGARAPQRGGVVTPPRPPRGND